MGGSANAQKRGDFVVVLDAGHGGKDPGKIGYEGAKEKDVALDIVLRVGRLLSNVQNVKVIYTRTTDVFVDLWKRGDIANKADADLFVSVHCNAHTSEAMGAETWVLGLHANERNFRVAKAENEVIFFESNHEQRYAGYNPNSPVSVLSLSLEQEENLDKSLLLASIIQNEFEKSLHRINRGVKQAGFVVLHQTYMPSVLIETGFLTSQVEGKYLLSEEGKNQMALSIGKSINKYIQDQNINTAVDGISAVPPKKDTLLTSNEKIVNQVTKEAAEKVLDNVPYFKVQIATDKTKLNPVPSNFRGLDQVERVSVGSFYKYYFGKFLTIGEAKEGLALAVKKGYKTAFIVPFNGAQANEPSIEKPKSKEKNVQKVENVLEKAKELPVDTGISFYVQLATSVKNIGNAPQNFKGLKGVEVKQLGTVYKYFYGKTTKYNEVLLHLEEAKSKGYQGAFVVAFKADELINIEDAIKKIK